MRLRLKREPMPAAAGEIPAGLRELEGPAAIGDDRRHFLRLTWALTKLDWHATYQRPVLGYGWTILAPVLMGVVLYLAFSGIIRPREGREGDYAAAIVIGITLFTAFTSATTRAMASFGALVRQLEIPRLALPMASVATAFLTLCMAVTPILGLMLVVGVEPTITWLLFPGIVLGLLLVTIPLAALVAVLNAYVRDISLFWQAATRALFFTSPIILPIERYPESFKPVLEWNPLAVLIAQARVWVVDADAPSWADVVGGWDHLVYPIAVIVTLSILAVWAFRSLVGGIAEHA